MHKITVFDNNVRIGYGYVFLRADGQVFGPDLFYENGEKLPQGWYHLVMTDETELVVMPRRQQ